VLSGRRLISIDALRGVAALGVVLYHTNAIPGVDRRLFFGDAFDAAAYTEAVDLFSDVALADHYVEFLTLPAYEHMP